MLNIPCLNGCQDEFRKWHLLFRCFMRLGREGGTMRTLDISKVNQGRHKWQRIDTCRDGAVHLGVSGGLGLYDDLYNHLCHFVYCT